MTTSMGAPDKRLLAYLALLPWLVLSACAIGPSRVPSDRFNYNEAIARSSNEQMLLNLVRLRYRETPIFLAVASVLQQYVVTGVVAVSGATGNLNGFPTDSIGGSANLRYIERPTITYTPLTGDEFTQQLLTPIPSELLFSLVQSGWPPDLLLVMGVQRINHVENVPFFLKSSPEDRERERSFQHVVQLFIKLATHGAMELQRGTSEDPDTPAPRYLVFEENPDPGTQALIDELKESLHLDQGRSRFLVTNHLLGRNPDEITIRLRSVLALMGFLSRGVEIPAAHIEEGRATANEQLGETESPSLLVPLRIHSSTERPADSFTAVQYQGYWFSIAHSDLTSKEAFTLVTYLFQMQAPHAPTLGPLLTVPTG
ncbi:MAG: hypothetical protein V3T38_01215 [Gammaproteobacteria bacterium]